MATELIAVGNTQANSADITVAAGTPVTVFLKNGGASEVLDSAARCDIQVKGSGGFYYTIGRLDGTDPIKVIDAPGTYRISKYAGPSFGVDQS